MKKIMFCGGGSAGHVIPNVAIMRELKDRYEVEYMGTDGIEYPIIRAEGFRFHMFEAPRLVRGKILENLSVPCKLKKSIAQAKDILMREKPSLVFCKGGYVSLPPAIAAKKLGIPVIAHESDLSPGLANKIIAKFAAVTLTSFPETAEKFARGRYSGPPIRKDAYKASRVRAMEKLGLDARQTIIVFGGGSGSQAINAAVRSIAPEVCKEYNILHICGKGNVADAHIRGYSQTEFVKDMGSVYACADFAVARAGSNSAFELIINKVPTLFIPLENKSTRGDQIKNAEYFERKGLCRILRQRLLTPENLYNQLFELVSDRNLRHSLEENNLKSGNNQIINEIERAVINSKK